VWLTKLAKLYQYKIMQTVSLTQAKINFYHLVNKVLKKKVILITKYGKPVAKLGIYNASF